MTTIKNFATLPLIDALKDFFKSLNVPINYLSDLPASPQDILDDKFNHNKETHQLINETYALGIVTDAIFDENAIFESIDAIK